MMNDDLPLRLSATEYTHITHLMKLESHWKPSAYPTRFITEHMKISTMRAPGFFCFESFPKV